MLKKSQNVTTGRTRPIADIAKQLAEPLEATNPSDKVPSTAELAAELAEDSRAAFGQSQ
jgi:hypothetical protein